MKSKQNNYDEDVIDREMINKTKKHEKQRKEIIYGTLDDILELVKKCEKQPIYNNSGDITEEQRLKNFERGIERLNKNVGNVENKFKYTPPFILRILSFIPSIRSIVINNSINHAKLVWENLSIDERRKYISNKCVHQTLEILKKD